MNRVRFLAVAAALAGVASFQACTVNNNNTPDDGEAGESNNGGKNAAGSNANPGGADEGGSAQGGSSSGAVGGAAEGGAAQGGATEGGAAPGGASQGGAGGAESCDDTVGEPSCEGVNENCSSYCAAAVANLKPAAAVAAITCLEAQAVDCDGGYACLRDATAAGCAEDVTAACETAATECTDDGSADPPCSQLLSGLNDAARTEAISCINEACFSVYSCAEGLFFQ